MSKILDSDLRFINDRIKGNKLYIDSYKPGNKRLYSLMDSVTHRSWNYKRLDYNQFHWYLVGICDLIQAQRNNEA